jgi:hypothetical protein
MPHWLWSWGEQNGLLSFKFDDITFSSPVGLRIGLRVEPAEVIEEKSPVAMINIATETKRMAPASEVI